MHLNRSTMRDPVRLETRLLVLSPQGWQGYTYVYNDDQSDAVLLDDSMVRPIEIQTDEGVISQPYYFPSRSDCFACHTKAEGFVLGMTTRQMNHTIHYQGHQENQISMLDRLGVFDKGPTESPDKLEKFPLWGFGNFDRSDVEEKDQSDEHFNVSGQKPPFKLTPPEGDRQVLARAWLEVNCAVCHRPQGIAPHNRDMRFHVSNQELRLIGEVPSHGQLSPPGSELIKPAAPLESELFFRINRRGPRQMPPLATKMVDPIGHQVIKQWIAEMVGE
jgi:hypothetical protein